jgi:hypothetical protein
MIRTVWLGVFLLLGIAVLASFRFAVSPQQPVELSKAVALASADIEPSSVGMASAADTLTKGDRLQIAYVAPATDVKPTATAVAPVPAPMRPAAPAPKIVSRHWHDPHDRKVTQAAKPKARDSRKSTPVGERRPAVEASSCQPDALDGLRQLFNMRGNCPRAN